MHTEVQAPGRYSHPDDPVRHSYPLVQTDFGFGAACGLLMRTLPFLLARLGILVGMSLLGIAYWVAAVAVCLFVGKTSALLGWGCFAVLLVLAGGLWRGVVRYFLHLLKAGHIAVLTELVTRGQVGDGQEGMFGYGKRVVKQRFGEINVLFALDLLVDGVVRGFNRTLDWVGSLIPLPGLDSVQGLVKALLSASSRYIDETIFSYNLARGDDNVFRSSKDGLIYYAQNAKAILKTAVWVVILEKVLSGVLFVAVFLPTLALASLAPDSFGIWPIVTAILLGLVLAADVQQAVLHPLFLTMVMLRFHAATRDQSIDQRWDGRLKSASEKFHELATKAAEWIGAPEGVPSPVIATAAPVPHLRRERL